MSIPGCRSTAPRQSAAPGWDGGGRRPRAVTELVLDQRAQLAKGLVVFGDQEERVVAEPRVSKSLADDPAPANALGFKANLARRVGHGQGGAERGGATFVGNRRECLQQLAVVRGVIAGLARIACREDTGRTLQGIDGQTRIVSQNPVAKRKASSAAFLRALPAKVSAFSSTSGAAGNSAIERIVSRASWGLSSRPAGSVPPFHGISWGSASPERGSTNLVRLR